METMRPAAPVKLEGVESLMYKEARMQFYTMLAAYYLLTEIILMKITMIILFLAPEAHDSEADRSEFRCSDVQVPSEADRDGGHRLQRAI